MRLLFRPISTRISSRSKIDPIKSSLMDILELLEVKKVSFSCYLNIYARRVVLLLGSARRYR